MSCRWPPHLTFDWTAGSHRLAAAGQRARRAAHNSVLPVIHAMRTQYFTVSSLDGFIATEGDSLEWLFPLGDINDTGYSGFIAQVGALAMGAATYEWMLRHAEKVAQETGSAWPNGQPMRVA